MMMIITKKILIIRILIRLIITMITTTTIILAISLTTLMLGTAFKETKRKMDEEDREKRITINHFSILVRLHRLRNRTREDNLGSGWTIPMIPTQTALTLYLLVVLAAAVDKEEEI